MAVASRPARARRAIAAPPALVALMALSAVLAFAWSLVLPPLQGPDESAHIAAITRLVEHGTLTGGDAGLPREILVLAQQGGLGPLIGNLAARPAWTAADRRRAERAVAALGARRAQFVQSTTGPPTQGTARNPPLYTVYEAIPYTVMRGAPLLDRLALMRIWNIPLLLVTVVACWLLAAEMFPRSALAPFVAGALAALQPELLFETGVINPDNMLVALFSVFCLLAVRLIRRGPTRSRIAWLCAVCLGAMATHPRGAALLPCAALAIALAIPWRTLEHPRRVAGALGGAFAAVALAAVLVARSVDLNLSGTSLHVGAAFSARQFASYLWQFYLPRLPFMNAPLGGDYGIRQVGVDTAWGTFASLEVRFPGWVFTLIEIGLLAVAAAAVSAAVRRPHSGESRRCAVLLAGVVVATLVALHVAAYRLLLVNPSDPIIVGRQLLVLIAPVSVVFAYAITSFPRAAQPATALLVGALVALDLAGLGLTAIRFYA